MTHRLNDHDPAAAIELFKLDILLQRVEPYNRIS